MGELGGTLANMHALTQDSDVSQATPPTATPARDWWRTLGCGLVLFLLTLLAYLPALRGGFVWDDNDYVTENRTLRSVEGLKQIWFKPGAVPQYYPLVHTTFWFEYHLWELNPFGYHIVNVLLHGLGAILLWRVLVRLELQAAWLAAALFAVHPVCVESVAWITERKNVLSGVFYFAAALLYLRFLAGRERRLMGERHWVWYVLALVCFIAALLSKTVTCSLPAALLLVMWWKHGRVTWRDAVPLLPWFALGVVLGLHTAWMEKHTVGAQGDDWALSFWERVLIAGRALWFYAGKLVWPSDLTFVYPRWVVSTRVWWQWLYPAAALAVVCGLWWRLAHWGRGPLTAVLFFAVTLFPALSFINVYPMRYSFVADHFQYLAAVGLITLLAAGLRRAPRAAVAGVLLVLSVLTWRQASIYADLETLWRDTLAKNPKCWMAWNNLGLVLKNRGDFESAAQCYRAALEIRPLFEEAWSNLGNLKLQQGQYVAAVEHYHTALEVRPSHPTTLYNLGCALQRLGRLDEALAAYQSAVELDPANADAWDNLATVLSGLKRFPEAIAAGETSLRLNPGHPNAKFNLALTLLEAGRTNDAVAQFEQRLSNEPNDIRTRLALAHTLLELYRLDSAREHYRAALRADPSNLLALQEMTQLAGAFMAAGQKSEAQITAAESASLATATGNAEIIAAIKGQLAKLGFGQPSEGPAHSR